MFKSLRLLIEYLSLILKKVTVFQNDCNKYETVLAAKTFKGTDQWCDGGFEKGQVPEIQFSLSQKMESKQ